MISSLEQDKYKISLKYVAGTEGKKSEQKKKNHVKVIHCKKKKDHLKISQLKELLITKAGTI